MEIALARGKNSTINVLFLKEKEANEVERFKKVILIGGVLDRRGRDG